MSQPAAASWLSVFWTPLVVVTAAHAGRRSGQIAVSVHGASIVPARPRLTVGLWKNNFTRELVEASEGFAVHLLRDDQDELVYHFGLHSGRDQDKLATLTHRVGITGAPLLDHCLARFECRLVNQMDGGDHTIFLGEVIAAESRSIGEPLWWRDLRTRMPADLLAQWQAKSAADAERSLAIMDQIADHDIRRA